MTLTQILKHTRFFSHCTNSDELSAIVHVDCFDLSFGVLVHWGLGGPQRFFSDFLLWLCLEPLTPIGKVRVF